MEKKKNIYIYMSSEHQINPLPNTEPGGNLVPAVPVRTAFIWKHHEDIYHLGTSAAQIITTTNKPAFLERNLFFTFPKETNFAYSSSSTGS